MSDLPLLLPPDLTYESVEIIKCLDTGVCTLGLSNHEPDCLLFSDSSHARNEDGSRTYL